MTLWVLVDLAAPPGVKPASMLYPSWRTALRARWFARSIMPGFDWSWPRRFRQAESEPSALAAKPRRAVGEGDIEALFPARGVERSTLAHDGSQAKGGVE